MEYDLVDPIVATFVGSDNDLLCLIDSLFHLLDPLLLCLLVLNASEHDSG